MPDTEVHSLPSASTFGGNDYFLIDQSSTAKKITGQALLSRLRTELEAHGGIKTIISSKSGNKTTITITMADNTTFSFQLLDGAAGANGRDGRTMYYLKEDVTGLGSFWYSATRANLYPESTELFGSGVQHIAFTKNGRVCVIKDHSSDVSKINYMPVGVFTSESGVYIGTNAPTNESIKVWIKTNGQGSNILHIRGDDGTWIGVPSIAGPPGQDGDSPTVSVSVISGGHRVTIHDKDGDHSFDVLDGEGHGDMASSVYDPTGKETDIFAYADSHGGMSPSIYDPTGKETDIFAYADAHGGYVAEYGVTTFSQALTAFNNGSLLYAIRHYSSSALHVEHTAKLNSVSVNSSGIVSFTFGTALSYGQEQSTAWTLNSSGWREQGSTAFLTYDRFGAITAEYWSVSKDYNAGDYAMLLTVGNNTYGLYRAKIDNTGYSPDRFQDYWEKVTLTSELSALREKKNVVYTATITSSSWSQPSGSPSNWWVASGISVSGLKSTDDFILDLQPASTYSSSLEDIQNAFGEIYSVGNPSDGSFNAYLIGDKPSVDIPVRLMVLR